ncbi:uncharacterized protein [Centruroides vittatus]|uniref:uncharacterized protein n=1 Tax=Centruroides vittatus TaxID=120091 RepID=UPI00350F3DAD
MYVKFRVISSWDNRFTERFKQTLKDEMKKCKIHLLWPELERTENPEEKLSFDEKTIDLIGRIINFESSEAEILDRMIKKWCTMNTEYWMVLIRNNLVSESKFFHQKIELDLFSMGVLTSLNEYVFYHLIEKKCFANFYHDTRTLEINCDDYQIKIKYSSVRRILAEVLNSSIYIFIDVKYPPPVFCNDIRVLTLPSVDREIHGKSTVFMIRMNDVKTAKAIIDRFSTSNNMSINYVCMTKRILKKHYPIMPSFDLGHFDCNYNLHAILTRNFVPLEQLNKNKIWNDFIQELQNEYQDKFCLSKALEYILDIQDQGILFDYRKTIKTAYDWMIEKDDLVSFDNDEFITPNTMKLIRRVVLTPTRAIFYPPEFQFKNRMLRNYNSDYALRVSFRDDDNFKLSGIASNCHDDLFYMAINKPMLEGFKVGERHYKLLAWSNSQIRDHGVWMYAKDDKGHDAEYIRNSMGDFSGNKTVAKYMARLGQCFSQTEDIRNIPPDAIKTVDDIEGGLNPDTDKPYCFSDGVGRMSVRLAKDVSKMLKLKNVPCAYQIRFAGYKGMLVMDPTLTDTGIDLVFRKSMKKFDSPSDRLEIVKRCQAIPVQLNRPMINILNQLGVPNNIFLEMQEEMLSYITDILIDDEKAADYLTSKIQLKTIGGFIDMVKAGIGLTGDPFFRGMLLCLREKALLDIKIKARLAVKPTDGRNMFGVMDETGTLEYGQVFVQYTKDIINQEVNTETEIYTGPVLVTKNPCTQPGDIRLLEAIDVPELHHLVDCVAFPQKGPRPHPNEMAGSDLDGDEYAVIWKKDLFFSGNREPENFPSPPEKKIPQTKFKLDDSVQVLSDYIKNDQIGTIGNAHLAISDCNGINVDVCKQIARKFSWSLDYVKSGYFEPLSLNEKPKKYPDFMERVDKETYISNRALGELYRNCKLFERNTSSIELDTVDLKPDPDLIYEGWEEYRSSAFKSKTKYDYLLQCIMQRYGIQTEVELITGAFRQVHERHSQRHDIIDVEKFLIASVEKLHERFREEFYKEFGLNENEDSDFVNLSNFQDKILKKASAWYAVTYLYRPKDFQNSTRFLSFPWIVAKHLITLKLQKFLIRPAAIFNTSIINFLDKRLADMAKKLPKPQSEMLLLANCHKVHKNVIQFTYRLIIGWLSSKERLESAKEAWLAKYFNKFLDKNCYYNERNEEENIKTINIINLCFSFLKMARNESSFPSNLQWIPSYARDTYHLLAATGNPKAFCPIEDKKKPEESVEMEPIKLLTKIIPGDKQKRLQTLRKILGWLAPLDNMTLRIDEKFHVVISAKGPFKSISFLQELFTTDTETLKSKLDEWYEIIHSEKSVPKP